jgi:hypothetical protein
MPQTPEPQSPLIFDRHLLRARRRRAAAAGAETFLLDRAAADLAERLTAVLRRFDCALDLGTPTDVLRRALAGGDTLTELRQAFAAAESEVEGGVSPRVAPFADVRDLGGLLQRAGFALPVTDVERITVRYDHAFALMHDLRRMGATNALIDRRRTPLKRATLLRMAEIYAERFADPDGRLRATFEIIWLLGWAPHPSQQKPLRPGSAQARLADALGTQEISTGEKAGE